MCEKLWTLPGDAINAVLAAAGYNFVSPAQVAGALDAHNPGGAESACQPSKSLKTKNFTDDYPSSIHFYYTHKI